jgi:hypothetical protein
VLATNKGGRDVPGEAKQRGLEATLHTGAELEACRPKPRASRRTCLPESRGSSSR